MSGQSEREEGLGVRLQAAIDRTVDIAAARPGGPIVLGVVLATGVVGGGIGAFLLVWGILVGFFA
jgi:hypothetical protein